MPDPALTPMQLLQASSGDYRLKDPKTGKLLYDYHWKRIITALVLVLILLVASVYAISLVLVDEKTTSQPFATEAIRDSGAKQPSASVEAATPNYNRPEVVVDAPPAASNPVFYPQSVQILSPNVARFILCSGVEELEPVGGLQDIKLHNDSPARLFAYSDVNNIKDEHLSYVWKHRNRIVNTVNIGVWSNRWRSYASKNIEQRLAGDWQVELRDSSNRLLAKAGFTFEPGN
ncbi:DUF2914 domain-containing protein [Pseudomaricurvus alcaniphilus]|uniref:DUF2914 domain-containing protein n=1 Tax=Pseudomaricurvus alcaniphilus TaxID=1166482 RepID=UPI00140E823A|nr:DUF2914 domain-containing protein [Pseudomaricurvus alcaniphilus]NHN39859.1 DUF2914 domain-containing protein [Pseudomaricurvus alcaniphilus]